MLNPRVVAAIRAEPIALGKAFYTYEIRNAWVDWNGTTSITHRPSGFTLTIEEAKDWAERSRVQGSRFRIEEIPISGIYGTSVTLYLSERKSSRLLARYADVICSPTTLATLAFVIDTSACSGRHLRRHRAAATRYSDHRCCYRFGVGCVGKIGNAVDDDSLKYIRHNISNSVLGCGFKIVKTEHPRVAWSCSGTHAECYHQCFSIGQRPV